MIKQTCVVTFIFLFAHLGMAQAQNWVMDKSKSEIAFQLASGGTPMVGDFSEFEAQITLNPDDTSTAKVNAQINAASLSVDDRQAESTALGRGWLFPKEFPLIEFTSTNITKTENGIFNMTGDLKVKDVTKSITFPFKLNIDGDKAHATASFGLDRAIFNLGSSGDADPKIKIKLSIHAVKK